MKTLSVDEIVDVLKNRILCCKCRSWKVIINSSDGDVSGKYYCFECIPKSSRSTYLMSRTEQQLIRSGFDEEQINHIKSFGLVDE